MQANMPPKPSATPGAARKSRHPAASHCHGASKATRLMPTTAEGLAWTISSAIMALRLPRRIPGLCRAEPCTQWSHRTTEHPDANLHLRPHWLPVLDLDQTITAAASADGWKGLPQAGFGPAPSLLGPLPMTQSARQSPIFEYRTTFLSPRLTFINSPEPAPYHIS